MCWGGIKRVGFGACGVEGFSLLDFVTPTPPRSLISGEIK